MKVELLIQNGKTLYSPPIEGDITWSTERKGSPGKLEFNLLKDKDINFEEGNPIRLRIDGKNIFYGFLFSRKQNKNKTINITAYDQLRYLKNKETYVYSNKTADAVIKMIVSDFNLKTGTLENTKYKIPTRVEDNTTLFDMIENALGLTLENRKEIYTMYDDFGKITLKNLKSMQLNLLIDEETGENYDYSSSIDTDTYNKIKLVYENEKSGKREVYIAQDSKNMNKWGTLQFFDTLKEEENGKIKVNALLSLYNKKTRGLGIKDALGDTRVRAGCLLPTRLDLGDVKLNNFMLVEKCKHTFSESKHRMDLTLRGGDFIA